MVEEQRTAPAWSLYLSPAILMLAALVWIWFYYSSDPLDTTRNLSLFMAIFSAIGAIFRLVGVLRKRRGSGG